MIEQFFNGIITGSIYALGAVGLGLMLRFLGQHDSKPMLATRSNT